MRDRLYDLIARNRYRWFGRLDVCILPTSTSVGSDP
jgi:predicted DCC family thiol-disulfide oxidoreductase YuxK